MRFKICLTIILILSVFYTNAQWQSCKGVDGKWTTDLLVWDSVLYASGLSGVQCKTLPDGEWENCFYSDWIDNTFLCDSVLVSTALVKFFFISFDKGYTWETIEAWDSICFLGYPFVEFNDAIYNWGISWNSSEAGLYCTKDYGNSWSLVYEDYISDPVSFSTNEYLFFTNDTCIMRSNDPENYWDCLPKPNSVSKFFAFHYDQTYQRTFTATNKGVYIYPEHMGCWVFESDSLPPIEWGSDFHENYDSVLLACRRGLYYYDDELNYWKDFSQGLELKSTECINSYNDTWLCGNMYGIYKRDNNDWEGYFEGLNLSSVDEGLIYQDNIYVSSFSRLYKSEDKGENFQRINVQTEMGDIINLNTEGDLIFACAKKGFYTSNDEGISWIKHNEGLESVNTTSFCITDKYYFLNNNNCIYRSLKDSIYWEKVPDTLVWDSISGLTSIDPILMVSKGKHIYRSFDYGSSFDTLDIEVSPWENHLHSYSEKIFSYCFNVSFSDDFGLSWEYLSNKGPIYENAFYANDNYLVYGLNDAYTSYHPLYLYNLNTNYEENIVEGIPNVGSGFISVFGLDDRIFASKRNGGLWYRDNLITSNKENSTETSPLILYPNPATDWVYIHPPVAINTDCVVNIYTISGKRVLTKRFLQNDEHKINVSDLESGLYILEFYSEREKYSGKMIIRH